jgi:hypothetical protein
VPEAVPIIGPVPGFLQDNGEELDLQRPDTPDTNGVPRLSVDTVRYHDHAPWPAAAAGTGASLQRLVAGDYGNDPTNWFASGTTPGRPNQPNQAPTVSLTAPLDGASFPASGSIWLEASAADIDGRILRVAFLVDGLLVGEATASPYRVAWVQPVGGTHTLAAQATDDSFGTTLSPAVTVTVIAPSPVTLIAAGSVWQYLDDGTDPGTAWRELGFDDLAWPSGPAQLGYGDDDEATPISYGGVPTNKYITAYFRRTFQLADAAGVVDLSVRVLRDDGAVVYLNGTEVFRSNLPTTGPILSSTRALTAVEDNAYYGTNVAPALLRDGLNVLAVEVHQVSPTSSDLSFDGELTAMRLPAPGPLVLAVQPAGDTLLLSWPATQTPCTLEAIDQFPPQDWTPIATGQGPARVAVSPTNHLRFYRLRQP